MVEREPEEIIDLSVSSETTGVCPFTEPQGKRIGDSLIALMIIVPLSLLIYFVVLLL